MQRSKPLLPLTARHDSSGSASGLTALSAMRMLPPAKLRCEASQQVMHALLFSPSGQPTFASLTISSVSSSKKKRKASSLSPSPPCPLQPNGL